MSPSIEMKAPEHQSVCEAALALAAFDGLSGLPPVCEWKINTGGTRIAVYGGTVSGQLSIYGLPLEQASEARLSALAALADRFGGTVRSQSLSNSDVLVHTHVEFTFRGVPFAVWAHVLPEGLRPAASVAVGHPDVDGSPGDLFDPCDPSGGVL